MNPKVSICIPAYKQIAILRMVLDSIRIQTFEDYELIITDDSPDDEVEILLRQFDFKEKLKYRKNPIPLGSPSNWNYAVSLAQGEYIKILHGDDFFTSNQSLAKYVELLDKNPKTNFGFSASEVWRLSNNIKSTYSCSEKYLQRIKKEPYLLFLKNVIGGPSSTIYRRNTNLTFDPEFKWLVDIDFYIRMLNMNKQVAYCAEPLICTSDGAEGQITQAVSNDKQIQVKEHLILFKKLLGNNTVLNKNKFAFFFKLLFNKYKIKNLSELNAIVPLTAESESFFSKVLISVRNGMPMTRILVKFYNSSLNKNILKLDLF